jgi:hypothetical protein
MRGADGRVYASGAVPPETAWTDEPPEGRSLDLSKAGLGPASYELREWAPDPKWGPAYEDDVVGDTFLFAQASEARRFFDEVASVRCHRSGVERPAPRPPGARNLIWVNPDGVTEEDVFLLRGRAVYRIAEVRAGRNQTPRWSASQQTAVATINRLACTLPGAACPQLSPGGRAHGNRAHPAVS